MGKTKWKFNVLRIDQEIPRMKSYLCGQQTYMECINVLDSSQNCIDPFAVTKRGEARCRLSVVSNTEFGSFVGTNLNLNGSDLR